MNIKLVILLVSAFYALEATECQEEYTQKPCNEKVYKIGWDMNVSTYSAIYDSDQDGVSDALDKCPDTPLKDAVDAAGCRVNIEFKNLVEDKILEDVLKTQDSVVVPIDVSFGTREESIEEKYFEIIGKFADFLNENSKYSAKIVGHTDSRGVFTNNTQLSMNRAKSVVDALVGLGIDADRLSYDGVGPNEPIATNSTESGRAQNRRIEAILTVEGN